MTRFAIPDGVKLDRRAFGAGLAALVVAGAARARPQWKTHCMVECNINDVICVD